MSADSPDAPKTGDPAEGGGAGTSPGSVLIVEDEFLVALDVELALQAAGVRVLGVARTADEAVARAIASRPALVIMDIRLAGKRDGIDAALEIYREIGIRCIFATAHNDRATMIRADPAHPLGWMSKPYSTAALVRKVLEALAAQGSG